LNTTAEGMLLRANLDRESARQDFVAGLWSEFLEVLVRAAPSPKRPFEALQSAIDSQRSRFLRAGVPLHALAAFQRVERTGSQSTGVWRSQDAPRH
jgi:hypothetical protein